MDNIPLKPIIPSFHYSIIPGILQKIMLQKYFTFAKYFEMLKFTFFRLKPADVDPPRDGRLPAGKPGEKESPHHQSAR
jgi:hypothetical protein